jgi:predicted nucleic acid-binding protein
MVKKVFLDTNVVLDFLLDRKPFSEYAAKIFELAETGKLELYLSSLSINNIYYVSRKIIGHQSSIQLIRELLEMAEILNTDKNAVLNALDSEFKDFEDGLQHAVAISIDTIDIIFSQNIKDFKNSVLPVMTPEIFLRTT